MISLVSQGCCLIPINYIIWQNLAKDEYESNFVSAVVPPGEVGVQFDDIGALEDVKKALNELVILPMRRPELFSRGNLLRVRLCTHRAFFQYFIYICIYWQFKILISLAREFCYLGLRELVKLFLPKHLQLRQGPILLALLAQLWHQRYEQHLYSDLKCYSL